MKKLFLCSYAENGEIAKKWIETFYPDLVIIDIMLPDINGLELPKQIRENIKTKKIPIIITGYQELDYKIKAAESDVNLYLTKPIEPQSLIGCALKLVEKYKMEKYRFNGLN